MRPIDADELKKDIKHRLVCSPLDETRPLAYGRTDLPEIIDEQPTLKEWAWRELYGFTPEVEAKWRAVYAQEQNPDSSTQLVGYIPELRILRFQRGETEYNVDAQVIAELWDAYVEGHAHDYDICQNCELIEQEHGRWEQSNPYSKPTCSVCGSAAIGLHGFDYKLTEYCPNCGAKMDDLPGPDAEDLEHHLESSDAFSAGEPVYECDPEKNTTCRKNGCYLYGGLCKLTRNAEYKRDDTEE